MIGSGLVGLLLWSEFELRLCDQEKTMWGLRLQLLTTTGLDGSVQSAQVLQGLASGLNHSASRCPGRPLDFESLGATWTPTRDLLPVWL